MSRSDLRSRVSIDPRYLKVSVKCTDVPAVAQMMMSDVSAAAVGVAGCVVTCVVLVTVTYLPLIIDFVIFGAGCDTLPGKCMHSVLLFMSSFKLGPKKRRATKNLSEAMAY